MKISITKYANSLNWFFPIFILMITFIGISNTTLKIMLMAFALLVFQMRNAFRLFDLQALILMLFLIIYVLIGSYGNNYEIIGLTTIGLPFCAYLTGKWFGSAAPSEMIVKNGIFALALALAIFPIIIVASDILRYGFSGRIRSIYVEQYDFAFSATVMAGFLTFLTSQIGGLFSSGLTLRKFRDLLFKASMVIILAIIVFRLGSRTQLAILAFCLYAGYLGSLSGKSTLKRISSFAVLLVLLALGISYVNSFSDNSLMSEYYQDRIGSSEYGVSTLGGRLVRWQEALESLYANPGGWPIGYGGYAHNIWLDAARVSGVMGLIFLLVFSVASVATLALKIRKISSVELKASVILGSISFFALFMVEPILDGYFYVFACYCSFLGIVSGVRKSICTQSAS